MDDMVNIVGHYDENGIIKGLTEGETKEYEALEIQMKEIAPKNPKSIKDFLLPEDSSKNYRRIKDRMMELEDKMFGIPIDEYNKPQENK